MRLCSIFQPVLRKLYSSKNEMHRTVSLPTKGDCRYVIWAKYYGWKACNEEFTGAAWPPKIHDPPACIHGTERAAAPSIPDDVSQIPVHDDHFYGDLQYSWDDYIEA